MKKYRNRILMAMIIVGTTVFTLAIISLFFGEELAARFDVIGIRIATLLVAFASFVSTSIFSFLVFNHNKTVSKINEDMDRRAELFRELQFASANYSIIEFMDRMLMYPESTRYVENYILKGKMEFHMIEKSLDEEDILQNPEKYQFISIKIPFRVVEGKTVASIAFDRLRFYRQDNRFEFITPPSLEETKTYILYNEHTKRKNTIVNLIVKKDDFFNPNIVNDFSKVEIKIRVISLLGVEIKGNSELYFSNPEQIEGNKSNTYRINSSNFSVTKRPKILDLPNAFYQE
ncbi:MAG: hypothetical protein ACOX40_05320 [Bacilli bacterium]|jgi:hypothetical protein|nr:hypothetical protein [Acholeplasmataceae bacterium]